MWERTPPALAVYGRCRFAVRPVAVRMAASSLHSWMSDVAENLAAHYIAQQLYATYGGRYSLQVYVEGGPAADPALDFSATLSANEQRVFEVRRKANQ